MFADLQRRHATVRRHMTASILLWLLAGVSQVNLWADDTAIKPANRDAAADELRNRAVAALAQLEGEISVPGLKRPVEVLRDRWGVPHIYAENDDDLFFAQGFVVAQDRLFQIDLWRRVALGETSAVVGKSGIDGDRFALLMRYRGDSDAEWQSYSPDARRIAENFTRGINASIDAMGDRLPVEFQLLDYRPARWKPEDILGRMSGLIMCRNFQSELSRAALIAAVGVENARRIAPTDPARPFGPVPELDLPGIDRKVLAGYEAATRALAFDKLDGGSNNWVVDGTLSASGKPLLAGDPHRALLLPSLRYLVHLHAPGWNVIGSGEPALPGVAIGHNERMAWAFTIVGTDQVDFYVEQTHPTNPTLYRVGDRWEPMTTERRSLAVRGEAAPVEVELRFTRHGAVIHQDENTRRAFVLRWVGTEPGAAAYLASLRLDRARSKGEFVKALSAWKVPALNMVFADVDGQTGWVAAGAVPIRDGWDGLLPVPGDSGKYEWRGFRAVGDLPQAHDPAPHFVATANHNILPPGYAHEISYEWSPPYRFREIERRLMAKSQFTLDDFRSIQQDAVTIPGQSLVRLLNEVDPAVWPKAAVRAEDVELLKRWNGTLDRESSAGALYGFWLDELLDRFYKPHVPDALRDFARSAGGVPTMLAALEKPTADWFGEKSTLGRDRLLAESLAAAGLRVREKFSDFPNSGNWGTLHTALFEHPLAGIGPGYAEALNRGPLPRPGDGYTPNAASHDRRFRQTSGASYRQLFDLADWDRGLATSTPGQSGQPESPHYSDLLPLWAEGEYFPLAYSRAKVESVTRHRLLLRPQ